MKATNKPNLDRQHGFSLLEILVAFAVLSLLLGVLLNIFSGGIRGTDTTGQYAQALQIGESVLARVGHDLPLAAQVQEGVENDIYRWRLTVSPYNIEIPADSVQAPPYQMFALRVEVNWESTSGQRQFALDSLRLAPLEQSPNGALR